jgi:integrase
MLGRGSLSGTSWKHWSRSFLSIIARRQVARVESCPYIFHREGQRIISRYRPWRTARKKAGQPQRHLHDARRTAARNMDRALVPRQVAKEIIGHKTDAIITG